jgi:LysM repeat protein
MHLLLRRILFLSLAAALSLSAACQRTFINPNTPGPNATAGLPTPLSPSGDRTAMIARLTGRVDARPDAASPWAAAAPGLPLTEGSQVRTGADGQAFITFTEGSKVQVGPDTTLTFNIFYPDLNSQLTSLAMSGGRVWVLLSSGALDVETPLGTASARAAFLSVAYDPQTQALSATCLQGTCSFGDLFIPERSKLVSPRTAPEPMTFADFGDWGVNVPEATQLAFYATEAVAQGSATMPVVATETPTPTGLPPTSTETAIAPPVATAPNQPTATIAPASPTTAITIRPPTPIPFTPIPPAPIIGQHTVLGGETIFCIGRAYGVLPGAIAQANGLPPPFTVFPGERLSIPEVQWRDILPGPVCPPQFASPFPGLPVATETPAASPIPFGPSIGINVSLLCIYNCGSRDGDYILRVEVQVSGGVPPYTILPGPEATFQETFKHCVNGPDQSGSVTVLSADGQVATGTWSYHDAACPPP